jgi:RNA polymerase sigma-70 factor (ECF subfamily)
LGAPGASGGSEADVTDRTVVAGETGSDVTMFECLAAAQAGDEHAFTRLYLDVQPRLRRYASILVGGQDADDVTAEAWLQIARDLRGFTGDIQAFRAWSARVVRNRALDLARARSRRPSVPIGLDDLLDRPERHDAWDLAAERMSTEQAVALIATLPRDQAEAVLLRAVVGLEPAAAAEVLGKRPGAVRVAAHRGLKSLARKLGTGTAPTPSADAE